MAMLEKRVHHQVTFVVLAAAVAAYALLQSLVVPVLSTLQVDLHTSQDTVTWVLTAYLLSASIFTPIMGRIGDMVGKEGVLVATLIALSVGSLLAALATNVTIMIVARVIQGVGGGVLPLAFGIIRDEFPKEKISGAVGILASLAAVGAGAGIVLAGPIVDALDYHWLFWLPMILTVAAAIAAHFVVPESPVRSAGRISWLPALLLSAWLVALLVALSEAPVWGWGSGKVIGLLVAAVVLVVAWGASEQRAATPLIDLTMMRQPAVWTNNLVALLLGVGMYGMFAFLPEFLQTPRSAGYGFGASITQSGLILLPSAVTMFVVGLYAGRFAKRVGGKVLVIGGCVIGLVAMLMLAYAHGAKGELYLATAIMGVGFGLAYSAMSSLIVAAVPPEQTGVASGMNANIRTIGGSIGAALVASIVTANLEPGGLPKEAGYTTGFALLAAALLLAAIAAVAIPRTRTEALELVDEPEHGELAILAGGTVVGDKPE
jgi:EmrB/QacA subfamily drug resistance transporter